MRAPALLPNAWLCRCALLGPSPRRRRRSRPGPTPPRPIFIARCTTSPRGKFSTVVITWPRSATRCTSARRPATRCIACAPTTANGAGAFLRKARCGSLPLWRRAGSTWAATMAGSTVSRPMTAAKSGGAALVRPNAAWPATAASFRSGPSAAARSSIMGGCSRPPACFLPTACKCLPCGLMTANSFGTPR